MHNTVYYSTNDGKNEANPVWLNWGVRNCVPSQYGFQDDIGFHAYWVAVRYQLCTLTWCLICIVLRRASLELTYLWCPTTAVKDFVVTLKKCITCMR